MEQEWGRSGEKERKEKKMQETRELSWRFVLKLNALCGEMIVHTAGGKVAA